MSHCRRSRWDGVDIGVAIFGNYSLPQPVLWPAKIYSPPTCKVGSSSPTKPPSLTLLEHQLTSRILACKSSPDRIEAPGAQPWWDTSLKSSPFKVILTLLQSLKLSTLKRHQGSLSIVFSPRFLPYRIR